MFAALAASGGQQGNVGKMRAYLHSLSTAAAVCSHECCRMWKINLESEHKTKISRVIRYLQPMLKSLIPRSNSEYMQRYIIALHLFGWVSFSSNKNENVLLFEISNN